MTVSRRHFLVVGQSLLAAAALPMKFFGAASTLSLDSVKTADLEALTKANFEPLVNSSFAVKSSGVTNVWLTLLSVEDMNQKTAPARSLGTSPKPSKTLPAKVDTFGLHFHGIGESLAQGTYELEHKSLGKFSLFVVPSGGSTYLAVVSHLLSGTVAPPKRVITIKPRVSAPATPENL